MSYVSLPEDNKAYGRTVQTDVVQPLVYERGIYSKWLYEYSAVGLYVVSGHFEVIV